jgi:DNA-binding SARP family transcriptional activator
MPGLTVHLLGRPTLVYGSGQEFRFRSRKSWALLAYLLLTSRPPTRAHLSSLLFAEADDPSGALRWTLAEIRRGLDGEGTLGGNPVRIELAPGSRVDVSTVTEGSWQRAVELPGLGAELLDGMSIRRAPAFESWLLSEQRAVQAASEAVLHDAALGSLSQGEYQRALEFAGRAAAMNPLEESHHALLIRLYRLTGDDDAAQGQLSRCTDVLTTELGVPPGPAVYAALRETPDLDRPADPDTVAAVIEAGSAAVAAGSAEVGIAELRRATAMADLSGADELRSRARLVLAEALIHTARGLDEAGLEMLYEADQIAAHRRDEASMAMARAELGYVNFLRGRYSRAGYWLQRSLQCAETPALIARATTYLAAVASDQGDYRQATALVGEALHRAREAREVRVQAYALSIAARVALLTEDLTTAEECLWESISQAEADHWLAFLPWPQALLGEVELTRGRTDRAESVLRQAFARARQLGDPCWEGATGRAVGLLAAARGDVEEAFVHLLDARRRCGRYSDPYVWMEASILGALGDLGLRHGHPDTARWVDELHRLASRTGMQEFVVRSWMSMAQLGHEGAREAAAIAAAEIDNLALVTMTPRHDGMLAR